MRRLALSAALVAATIALSGGCGLDAVGALVVDGQEGGAPAPDAIGRGEDGGAPSSSDAGDSGAPPPTCETDACALPAGGPDFGVVLYGDRSMPCPAGFDATDLVEDPTPGAGACTCGTCSVSGVDCNNGLVDTTYGSTNACANDGANMTGNNGQCKVISGSWSTWGGVVAPTATGGTCTAAASTVNAAGIATTSVRICAPQAATCAATLCTPPPSLKACSIHDGDVACPVGAPNKHVVASDVTATCAACSCTFTATCGGTMVVYANSDCTGSSKSLTAGACVQMNGFDMSSSKWTGTVNASCTNGAAPTPAIALVGSKTVCCP